MYGEACIQVARSRHFLGKAGAFCNSRVAIQHTKFSDEVLMSISMRNVISDRQSKCCASHGAHSSAHNIAFCFM